MFKFIGIKDYGSCCATCPHCGSEGRYIYTWQDDKGLHSAMAGCYKALTGHLDKNDRERYFELLADKQAKNKPLNGWDKNVLRFLGFLSEGKYTADWIDGKIDQVLRERKQYLATKRY